MGLRLPGWTGTGRSRSGASPHVSHGKRTPTAVGYGSLGAYRR